MRLRPTPFVFLLLPLVMAAPPLAGQSTSPYLDPEKPLTEFTVDLWTEDAGLPQNMASAIAQTRDGFMWLGMERGLARFDGVNFRVFDATNTAAFETSWVTALWPDADGTLWVGTAGGGVLRLQDGTFTPITVADGLPSNDVRALFRDASGTLWIGTQGGGVANLGPDGAVEVLSTEDGISSDFVLSITQDVAGSIWVGTAEGLNRISGNEIITFGTQDGLPGSRVNTVLGTRDGALWAGTADGGLARFDDDGITEFSTAEGLSSDFVMALYEDVAGSLWVGTNGGGLNRIRDGVISSVTARDNLPGNLILSLAGDRDGGLWLGMTGAGLGRMRDGVFRVVGQPEGLSADIALALAEDRGGDLWIGTAGGGVNRVTDDGVVSYTTEDGLGNNIVLALEPGLSANEVWVGMAAGGLSRIRDGVVNTFGPAEGLPSTQITDVATEPDGSLWLATPGNGLHRWRPNSGAIVTTVDGLPSDFITTLLREPDGTIWVGTRAGLARISGDTVTSMSLSQAGAPANNVTGLATGGDGTLWVTTQAGLARIHDQDVAFYGPEHGPFTGQLHAAVEDSLGFLWVSSNDGIARIRVADFDAIDQGQAQSVSARIFRRADGLRSDEANGGINPAGILHSDGSVWFPTMRGAARIQPAISIPERATPAPVLESMVVNEVTHPTEGDLELSPSFRTLEFHFTAPTYVAPDEVNFRYRLEGFDADWVESGARRVAFYTNLPPGSYRFRVAARRGTGAWSETEASQLLTLRPYLHETTLFRVLVALALAVLAWLAYRLRVRSLERRQLELVTLTAEQERTERALRESQESLQLALRSGRMGTWEWKVLSGGLTLDGAAQGILGSEAATLDGLLADLGPKLSPVDHAEISALPDGIAKGQESVHCDFPIVAADGTRHVEIRGQTFFDADGRPDHVLGVVADISELMTTQLELRQREEELRQAQKMEAVGRLAGGVAHDFNNLLTTILGRTHFLKDHVSDEEAREDLDEIEKSAERAANLTQQLLMFSRKQVIQPRVLDLNALIVDTERMLRRLVREDVVFETRLAPDLGPVRADPGGMEQVLVNLVVNAQDAMPRGGRLQIETENGALEGAPHVLLTVSDTGEGMAPETLRHAFDPFFTTKPVGKGTGLGLATVYGIVQQARGQVLVESQPDEGATFRIYLPRVTVEGIAVDHASGKGPVAADPGKHSTAGATAAPSGNMGTILLVEDDDAVRPLMVKVLERNGFEVVHASSGKEALEICQDPETSIDLLLSDVVMPGMSGRELAEAVKELVPDVPVLLVSGHHEDEILRRGVDQQETAFLRKPFDAHGLVRAVHSLLDADPGG